MKHFLIVLLAIFTLAACKNTPDPSTTDTTGTAAPNQPVSPQEKIPANQTKPDGSAISISETDIVGMEKGEIIGSNVTFRSGASIKSEKVGTFQDKEKVSVIGYKNVQNEGEAILSAPISVKGGGGSVNLPKGKAVVVEDFDSEKNIYTVSYEDPKKGRLEAQISASVVQTITYATWINVKRASGETGWVLGKFLKTN